jgi:hypothetical protein
VGQREGEVAEHLDVLVLEWRDALEVLVGDRVAGGSEMNDRVVEVLGTACPRGHHSIFPRGGGHTPI